jgi:hypothetical protein
MKELMRFAVTAAGLALLAAPAFGDAPGFYVGVSKVSSMHRTYGPFELDLGMDGESRIIGLVDAFTERLSPTAYEISVPVYGRISLDFTRSEATSTRTEGGEVRFDPPLPQGPGAIFSADIRTEVRTSLLTASVYHEPAPNLFVYARLGAHRTTPTVKGRTGEVRARLHSETDTGPWLGFGARYLIYRGLTLSVEQHLAGDGLRGTRVAAGWTF